MENDKGLNMNKPCMENASKKAPNISATKIIIIIFIILSVLLIGFGIVRSLIKATEGPRSIEGYTYKELLDGVPAKEENYAISYECFTTSENSVRDRERYNIRYRITNRDDRFRAFSVRKYRRGEFQRASPGLWLGPGETDEVETFLGWKDDFPEGCPEHELRVHQSPSEALVEGR